MPAVLWLRRDLRLADHPALLAARDADDGEVVPLFVLDDALRGPSGTARLAFLYRCLRDLDERLDGRLVVRVGDPVKVVPQVAREVEATTVHVSADFGPYGAARDERVGKALRGDDHELVRSGSPYAVAPGRILRQDGSPYRVFTPFSRAWTSHGWRAPAAAADDVKWVGVKSRPIPKDPRLGDKTLLPAGEAAALERLDAFLERLADYGERRDEPGVDATSRLSAYLKYGCIHPRTILHRVDGSHRESGTTQAAERLRTELAWREFYADVLFHNPDSARQDLNDSLSSLDYDDLSHPEVAERFEAWKAGRTGYPIVDAGIRQLLAEGWMHNRVRMITASFLVKDLHIWWRHGARWFLDQLVDGDLASNNHGWQWVAGTGTDAAPYFRIFNPVLQGRKFDPDGTYVRRYVPELRDVEGKAIHAPWEAKGEPPKDYPAPVVDHAKERRESLARYERGRR